MVDTPYPLPRQLRQTDVLVGNGGATYGPFDFRIFDTADVAVFRRLSGEEDFSTTAVTVTKVSGLPLDHFTVTFPDSVVASTQFVVAGHRLGERSAAVRKGSQLDMTALEKELSKIVATEQEMRRDIGRAIKVEFGAPGLTIAAGLADGDLLMKQGNKLVPGPDGAAIANAGANAERAEAAAELAEQLATDIGVAGRSQYATVPEFQATAVPAVVKRASANLARDMRSFMRVNPPTLPDVEHVQTTDGGWWEQVDELLTPEMFLDPNDGDNMAKTMLRVSNAAENIEAPMVLFKPGQTYQMDDQVVNKGRVVWWAYGAKLRMRSNPVLTPRGGFIRTQGSGTNVGAPFIYRDDMIIYGLHAEIAPGVMGVNCYGTTVTERVSFIDCIGSGARWGLPSDPVKQGGRAFSCHPRSRNIKFINCRAFDCSIGFHASDKADYDTVATPVLSGFTVTPGNPTVFTVAGPGGHGLTSGQEYSGWRFSGDWAVLNNVNWTVTVLNANSFSIGINSTGWVWNGVGRLSKKDTGVMRSYDLLYQGCVAENCSIAGIIFEQVIDSQDLETPRNFSFHGRLINCGTEYPADQGVINISGLPGVRIDAQVYNDAAHPIGAVLRGGGALCDINIRGKVHTAVNMINSRSSTAGTVNLDGGSAEHPQGTTRATYLGFSLEFNTVSGDLIATQATQLSETDNQNFTWRNQYDIEYSAVSIGGQVVHPDCKHATNDFRIKNMATGAITLIGGYTFESAVAAASVTTTGSVTVGNNLVATGVVIGASERFAPIAVGALPSASLSGAGSRRLVNDANATTFNSIVAAGGANTVPVYSDGTNWRIG
ncbi:hypothetical protein [Shinella kummerowiae]|uniref:hypothetical protein n=1 Tax=Shinella kummerowiae TaxID=417745 RepID=UPI0021B69D94|nr:hypothetical protein [Shinella kummerowiae]MCT7662320.1 hypothetical protein [Shinella kummerowiae]